MKPFEGIKVIDFGQYIAGPLAAKFLADYGAEVIHIDPVSGPMFHSDGNIALNHGKRNIRLNLKDEAGYNQALDLIREADVVIEGFSPKVMERLHLDYETVRKLNSEIIYCSIPGFSKGDERSRVKGWEGIIEAEVGLYRYCKYEPEAERAKYDALYVASAFGGFVAAHSIVAALIVKLRTGKGQNIEVPLYDACYEALGMFGQDPSSTFFMQKLFGKRDRPKGPTSSGLLRGFPCKDGRYLQLSTPDRGVRNLKKFFLGDLEDTSENLATRLHEELPKRTSDEWEYLLQSELKAAVSKVNTAREWLNDEYAIRSGNVEIADSEEYGSVHIPGKPFVLRETGSADRTVPGNGNITKALQGVRVLDLCQVLAGPIAGKLVSEYGAEVIKVDSPKYYELDGAMVGHETINNGKATVFLDLKKPEDREVFFRLVKDADVLHCNFAPDAREKLGLDEQTLHQINPDLIISYLNVFSPGYPRGIYRGHEEIGEAAAGIEYRFAGNLIGDKIAAPLCDMGTGNLAALAIMVALYHRIRNGKISQVHTSLGLTATLLQTPYMVDYAGRKWDDPIGPVMGQNRNDRIYRCSDGDVYLVDREKVLEEISEEQLEKILAEKSCQQAIEELEARGVTARKCRTFFTDAMNDSYAVRKQLSFISEHPFGKVRTAFSGAKLSLTPATVPFPVNEKGADSELVRKIGWSFFREK